MKKFASINGKIIRIANDAPHEQWYFKNKRKFVPGQDLSHTSNRGSSYRSFQVRSLVNDYMEVLSLAKKHLPDNDPAYQPTIALELSDMHTYQDEVIQCGHCKTVITYQESSQEECPFCHRDFDRHALKLKTSPLRAST